MKRYVSEEVNSNEVVELVIPEGLDTGEYEVHISVVDEYGFRGETKKLRLRVKEPSRLKIFSPQDGAVVSPNPTFILCGEDSSNCKVRFIIEFQLVSSGSEEEMPPGSDAETILSTDETEHSSVESDGSSNFFPNKGAYRQVKIEEEG